MSDHYIEYVFEIKPKEPASEILIAELGEAGFDSFVENENGLSAYIKKADWNDAILEDIFILKSEEFAITYTKNEIAPVNWNSEWEKNFQPIQVENTISVRAPFHEATDLPYEIVIEPKMSFGTGHHETTYAMLQQLMQVDLKDKKVLDMGCGTGILAIFASMKGATSVDAIDIDEWCYENTLENIERNNAKGISAFHGDASLLKNKNYDVIIANINRNILLNDMSHYANSLAQNGVLLLSGFYQEDIPVMEEELQKYDLKIVTVIERNRWVAIKTKRG
ncbi:MAG: 50S ribosomal protein L11 methyltransferase [Flavobacteriaceae bacterium]|nr:50S ribosomal protein L11 methyltransferase [Flavobacteriaceae bacterium]